MAAGARTRAPDGAGGSLLLVGAVVGSAFFQTLLELPLRRAETTCELRELRAAEQHEDDGQDDQEFRSEDLAEHEASVPAKGSEFRGGPSAPCQPLPGCEVPLVGRPPRPRDGI